MRSIRRESGTVIAGIVQQVVQVNGFRHVARSVPHGSVQHDRDAQGVRDAPHHHVKRRRGLSPISKALSHCRPDARDLGQRQLTRPLLQTFRTQRGARSEDLDTSTVVIRRQYHLSPYDDRRRGHIGPVQLTGAVVV